MLLFSIIIAFSFLAVGLLAVLDRYEAALAKTDAAHRANQPHYDAFADRRKVIPVEVEHLPAGPTP